MDHRGSQSASNAQQNAEQPAGASSSGSSSSSTSSSSSSRKKFFHKAKFMKKKRSHHTPSEAPEPQSSAAPAETSSYSSSSSSTSTIDASPAENNSAQVGSVSFADQPTMAMPEASDPQPISSTLHPPPTSSSETESLSSLEESSEGGMRAQQVSGDATSAAPSFSSERGAPRLGRRSSMHARSPSLMLAQEYALAPAPPLDSAAAAAPLRPFAATQVSEHHRSTAAARARPASTMA
eukprot:CAMPEP_0174233678 /NCGR_PEP_ID=MMETSP0417-20130205/3657_1 /TAXON_ID=242541 /ORGANISM="Mayorella sp, Strain BSH-02190019" /LENGTH=236 /DNA_ID=CAMNT_0015311933 /DNA_START=182 /DNA_END=889 /DNA_ORIENTATION=+